MSTMPLSPRLRALVILAALIVCPGPSHAQAPGRPAATSLVLLVRHAEKAAEPASDPPLSSTGVARSQALATALRDAAVTSIITTQLRRTRETAQPLAAARGLTPEVVPVSRGEIGAHVDAVVAAVRRQEGGVILVVGHSNSVPAIIAALGGPRLPDICEAVYANLFVLQLGNGGARLVQSRYGAPEPDPGPGCK